ncbi:RNA polymerase subunit sigma-70 [Tenacibaculum sp. Bg11-29]|nr:RNA polymerase subunit sigma-70 [Tenacibaculum sp. Bg11-29]
MLFIHLIYDLNTTKMNSIAIKITDEDLVFEIIRTNDRELFALLYERFYRLVYNKCYGFSKNKHEAEDLMHDVFIRLFFKLKTFKGSSKFSVWLYSFTYNFCVNYVNRNSYKKKQKITVITDRIKDNNDEVNDITFFELKSEKLKKALAIIPVSEKNILLMKYQKDMSINDISEILALGHSAVKMRIKRAKQKVIKVYSKL